MMHARSCGSSIDIIAEQQIEKNLKYRGYYSRSSYKESC